MSLGDAAPAVNFSKTVNYIAHLEALVERLWVATSPEQALTRILMEITVASLHHGSSVQIDLSIALSNCPVAMDVVAVVVPKSKLPNQLVGILFGHAGGIDRLNFLAIPRHVLRANGQEIPDGFWGGILADQYGNLDREIVSI
ncbi:hypothetical protein N7527_000375 [Penicillium freii]|nr:hypothetical protein N7527_000375 [Penicillium freii]